MNGRRAALGACAIAVPALLVATRLPNGDALLGTAAPALAAVLCAAGLLAALRPAWRWLPPTGLASAVGLLIVPASPAAVLDIPAPIAALGALVLVHLLYPLDASETPRLGREGGRILRAAVRLAPVAVALTVLAAAPWLLGTLLPDRLASSRELTGPLAPVLLAVLASAVVALVATGKAAAAALAGPTGEDDADTPPATPPEVIP